MKFMKKVALFVLATTGATRSFGVIMQISIRGFVWDLKFQTVNCHLCVT